MSRIREAKARANGSRVDIVAADRAVKSALLSDWKKLRASDAEISARQIEVEAARLSVQGGARGSAAWRTDDVRCAGGGTGCAGCGNRVGRGAYCENCYRLQVGRYAGIFDGAGLGV